MDEKVGHAHGFQDLEDPLVGHAGESGRDVKEDDPGFLVEELAIVYRMALNLQNVVGEEPPLDKPALLGMDGLCANIAESEVDGCSNVLRGCV